MRRRCVLLLAAMALSLPFLAGCSSPSTADGTESPPAVPASDAQPATGVGGAETDGEQELPEFVDKPSEVHGSATLPDDFPKDAPLGNSMTVAFASHDSKSGIYSVTATSPDSPETLATFYREAAAAQGWKEDAAGAKTQDEGNAMRTLLFSKGDRTLTIMLLPGEDATSVQLDVSGEE